MLQENLLSQIDHDRGDPVMRPFTDIELRKIKLEKSKAARTGVENEVCSICCDEVAPKTMVRRMPECNHMFHQK